MSEGFYKIKILPFARSIIKICRAYTNTQEDFEDYYQEVCLQIWSSRNAFKGNSEWSTWVYRLTLNVCLTLLKKDKNKRHHFVSDPIREDQIQITNFGDNTPYANLHSAIKSLSEIDRAVILLYLEERPYKEIAHILDTNPNNIGVRVKRIKERLKKQIKLETTWMEH